MPPIDMRSTARGRTADRVAHRAPGRFAFLAAAAVLVVVVLGGQLPSPLYAVYAASLGIGSTAITVLFAVYAAGVLLALLSLGHLSDHVGRRPILWSALAIAAASDVVFVVGAHAFGALLAGRVLSGLSIGLLSGTGAALLSELARPGSPGGGRTAGTATVIGGGSGALIAGAIAQFSAAATTVAYLVHLGLLAGAVLALAAIPETVPYRVRARPRLPWPRLGELGGTAMLPSALGVFCGFAVLGLASALTGSFLVGLGHPSHLLAGSLPFAMGVAAVIGPALVARWPSERVLAAGLAGLVPCLAAIAAGVAVDSLAAFAVGIAAAGAAFGAVLQGALRRAHELPGGRPGERFSGVFAAAYTGMAAPVVGAGVLADSLSETATVVIFGAAVSLLAAIAIALVVLGPRDGGR